VFFAPSQIIKGQLLLDEYTKYQTWFSRLPDSVKSPENAPAHVISLQYASPPQTCTKGVMNTDANHSLYYHAAILLLFRPFLRARFTQSDLIPSELCRQSATNISDLFAKHMTYFGTTGIYAFQIQCLLSACTIHLVNLPSIASSSNLLAACEAYHALVSRNTWALGSLKLIKELVVKWNIILPGDVEQSLYRPHVEPFDELFDDRSAPQAEILRGAKRGAFLNPSSQVMQKRPRLAPVQTSATRPTPGKSASASGSGSSTSITPPSITLKRGAGGLTEGGDQRTGQAGNFLFSPFPSQPAPLLGPVHTSTTSEAEFMDDLHKVVQDFDGLQFDGDGWFDPFMGL
jgi:hypothetical protein